MQTELNVLKGSACEEQEARRGTIRIEDAGKKEEKAAAGGRGRLGGGFLESTNQYKKRTNRLKTSAAKA